MTDAVQNKVPTHMSAQEITSFYEGHLSKAMTIADAGEKYLALDKVARHLAMHGRENFARIDDVTTGAKLLTAVGGVLFLAAACGGLLLAYPVIAAAATVAAATTTLVVAVPTLVGLTALAFSKIQNKLFPWVRNKYASAEVANNTVLTGLFGKVRQEMKTIETQTPVEELQKSTAASTLSKMKAFASKLTGTFAAASNPANDDNSQQSAVKITPSTPS
ncbi:MAG: hypothetical protein K8R48_07185 [Alphaproteobacteria bacterium]|nr:hypothetical protein [Alphaproteobacteria bacterium]